jgi:hypothetical protein
MNIIYIDTICVKIKLGLLKYFPCHRHNFTIQAGRVPNYAESANGELHATIFYYKELIKPRH